MVNMQVQWLIHSLLWPICLRPSGISVQPLTECRNFGDIVVAILDVHDVVVRGAGPFPKLFPSPHTILKVFDDYFEAHNLGTGAVTGRNFRS
jgi:hypothetical protein